MKNSIVKYITLAALATTFIPAGAKSRHKTSPPMTREQQIDHALSRLTWGVRPGDNAEVKKFGLKKWIDAQLHPERIPESPELLQRLDALHGIKLDTGQAFTMFQNRKEQPIRPFIRDVVEAKVDRAVYSNRQLEDVLADFWFNHFNVYLDKGQDRAYVGAYERDAIRPHVLGKFRELLEATASHPAMLFYLDNWQSVGSDAPARRITQRLNKKGTRGLNENYGRELLELHTLGVDGGYTQQDVIEVARCFTGWTIRQGQFRFAPAMHDDGEKIVLGVRIPAGGGKEDAEKVLDIISRHPSTARFISRKLAQRFVADDPPQNLVDAMAATFTKTDGNIREVMNTMLNSKDFWSSDVYRAKLKSPFELVISAVRAGQADLKNPAVLAIAAERLGQPLYRKLEPTGYSNSSEEWKNSASLLGRMYFATTLAQNKVPGMTLQWPDDPKSLLAHEPSPALKQTLSSPDITQQAAIAAVLGSPDFQKR